MKFLIFISFYLNGFYLVYGQYANCITPTGKSGYCVSILECGIPTSPFDNFLGFNLPFFQQDSLRQLLIESSSNQEHKGFLQNSQCTRNGVNQENGRPLVCCPNNSPPQINQPVTQQAPINNNNQPVYSPFNNLPGFQAINSPISQINPNFNNPLSQSSVFPNIFGPVMNNGPPLVQQSVPEVAPLMNNNDFPPANSNIYRGKCGKSLETKFLGQISERIVGGLNTEINEFPWLAALEYTDRRTGQRSFKCGGALINEQYVITAAHCVVDVFSLNINLTGVRLGEWDTSKDEDCIINPNTRVQVCNEPIDFRILKKIVHKDYSKLDPLQNNDIALLRLDRPVMFTDFIQPICLPVSSEIQPKNYVGNWLVVAGWGRTELGQKSDVKRKLDIEIRHSDYCNNAYRSTRLSRMQVCAGGVKNEASCSGDSGGPLMAHSPNDDGFWYMVGIVSVGNKKCGVEGKPGIFTKVDEYIPWIESRLNG